MENENAMSFETLTSRYEPASAAGGVPVKMWTRDVPVEDAAYKQLLATAPGPRAAPNTDPKATPEPTRAGPRPAKACSSARSG
jgi:hypothetical protein